MAFFRLLGLVSSMQKSCSRKGCEKSFIHGYPFDGGEFCDNCGKEFMTSVDHTGQKYNLRCRKYLEEDLKRFVETNVGEKFIPTAGLPENEAVSSGDVFFRRKIELVDGESEEENSFEVKMKEIDRQWEARYTSFQDNEDFVQTFRKNIQNCSNDALITLIRAGEAHAVRHRVEEKCDKCQDDCDVVELAHHTRDLGNIWLETVKEFNSK
jgi:hypothetical protein